MGRSGIRGLLRARATLHQAFTSAGLVAAIRSRTLVAMSPSRAASARKVNAFQAVGLLVAFVLVATLGGVLAAGLVMPAVATTSALTDTSVGLFDELPTALTLPQLSEKSTILAADGTLLATVYSENRIVVPLADISMQMRDAVIAVEDRRFYEHGGIDLLGMSRALLTNQLTGSNQGASTLTQQYVKNMLIQAASQIKDDAKRAQAISDAKDATGTEGYARKLREAKLAVTLEQRLSKDEILAGYLNVAQFGASVYGVEAACAALLLDLRRRTSTTCRPPRSPGITQSPVEVRPDAQPEGLPDPPQHRARHHAAREVHHPGAVQQGNRHAASRTP